MRKFITLIAAAAALLLCATSCDLSLTGDYTFSYEAEYQLSSEEQKEALGEYFNAFFDSHNGRTFHGGYSEAMTLAYQYLVEDSKDLDNDFINSWLYTDQDVVALAIIMTGKNTRVPAGYALFKGPEPVDE